MNIQSYTKHYYIEADRFVSKIGGGMRNISYRIDDHVYNRDIQNNDDYEHKSYYLFEDGQSMMHRHFDYVQVNDDIIDDLCFSFIKELQEYDEQEKFIFFYHKDHLGSSTQISNIDANIIHHIEYMPSGEQFSEQRDWWSTPYKFNGKELDSETNLYYYGARYYTAMENIWLSVDPLSDKYPSMSAYMYCAGNPVKYYDPDGRWIPGFDEEGKVTYTAEKGDNMRTFMKQYGLDAKTAGKIIGKSGIGKNDQIKAGETTISGETVKEVTGKDVLKLDWNSEQSTDQRKADQTMFAVKYSQKNSSSGVGDFKDFFSNLNGVKGILDLSNISISVGNGDRIPISNLSLGVSNGTTFKTFGEMPKDIMGTNDSRQEFRSSMNFKDVRPVMSIRFNSKHYDKYCNYYYNPASNIKK